MLCAVVRGLSGPPEIREWVLCAVVRGLSGPRGCLRFIRGLLKGRFFGVLKSKETLQVEQVALKGS